MIRKYLSILAYYYLLVQIVVHSQSQQGTNGNGCSQYLRNLHRMGPNLSGRLEIPVDEHFPKYKLKIGFSSPIHHMAIRQSLAKDTGNHREFVVDPMEMRKEDGRMHLDVFIRLQRMFGHSPRVTRIVYNNVALCGDPVGQSEVDESFGGLFFSTAPPRRTTTVAILAPLNPTQSSKDKDFGEDEEDIF